MTGVRDLVASHSYHIIIHIFIHSIIRVPCVHTTGVRDLVSLSYLYIYSFTSVAVFTTGKARHAYSALQCVVVCCRKLQLLQTLLQSLPQAMRDVTNGSPLSLQCVAVCCSVLQCVAVRCSALQCVAVRCRVLQCIAGCCSCCSGCCSL